MDSPFIIAAIAFFGIFFMFFFISLLSDLVIILIALGSAFLAYNIPEYYGEFRDILNSVPSLQQVGLHLPQQPDVQAFYVLAILIIGIGTILCIPVLPFSATYRHMLGSYHLSKRDENRIRSMMYAEIAEEFRRREPESRSRAVYDEDLEEEDNFAEAAPAPVARKKPISAAKPKLKPKLKPTTPGY